MDYTLKFKGSNSPLFISKDGKTLCSEVTDKVLSFKSFNEIAEKIISREILMPKHRPENIVVAILDFCEINKNIKNLSTTQDLSHKIKFIDFCNIKTIVSRRPAKIYLENIKMDIQDTEIDNLIIIQIDKEISKSIKINDTLVLCDDQTGAIYFSQKYYKVIDSVNIEKLFENRVVDPDNYSYIGVILK